LNFYCTRIFIEITIFRTRFHCTEILHEMLRLWTTETLNKIPKFWQGFSCSEIPIFQLSERYHEILKFQWNEKHCLLITQPITHLSPTHCPFVACWAYSNRSCMCWCAPTASNHIIHIFYNFKTYSKSQKAPSTFDALFQPTSDFSQHFQLVNQASDHQRLNRSQSCHSPTSRTKFPSHQPSPKPLLLCCQIRCHLLHFPSPLCLLMLMVPVRHCSFALVLTLIRALSHVFTLFPCHSLSYTCKFSSLLLFYFIYHGHFSIS
jgi:hypothetical protein